MPELVALSWPGIPGMVLRLARSTAPTSLSNRTPPPAQAAASPARAPVSRAPAAQALSRPQDTRSTGNRIRRQTGGPVRTHPAPPGSRTYRYRARMPRTRIPHQGRWSFHGLHGLASSSSPVTTPPACLPVRCQHSQHRHRQCLVAYISIHHRSQASPSSTRKGGPAEGANSGFGPGCLPENRHSQTRRSRTMTRPILCRSNHCPFIPSPRLCAAYNQPRRFAAISTSKACSMADSSTASAGSDSIRL
jgi:hypothetical protein